MNKFKQHIPNFFDTNKRPEWIEFKTTRDLLELEVIQRYGKQKDFSHFAMSENCLMEISDNGFSWWVVGYVKNPSVINLPQWLGWKYRAKLADGSVVTLTDEDKIASVCGDIITLQDGTTALKI